MTIRIASRIAFLSHSPQTHPRNTNNFRHISFTSPICHEPFLLVGILKSGHVPRLLVMNEHHFMLTIMTCCFICRVVLWDDLQWQSVQNDHPHKSYSSVMKTHYENQSHLRLIRVRFMGEAITWQGIPLLLATVTRRAL